MSAKPKMRAIPTPDKSFSSAAGLPAVYLRGGRKSFDDKEVLHDIDLMIEKGEVVSIIGPSGAGKSTLLRCLTLLDTFDAGMLAYDSLIVCQPTHGKKRETISYDKAAMQQARMKFGIVFQNYNLFPHMTVVQNIMDAPIVVQKREPSEVRAQARRLLTELGLTEHANKVPDQLSGGQQQRVAIARALCMNPRVIYFDEATSALDPKLTEDMLHLIRQLAKGGMAVGIVTHEMGFSRRASDRVCLLLDGSIVEEGRPEDVFDHPRDPRTRAFLSASED